MAVFSYRGRQVDRGVVKGTLEATDAQSAAEALMMQKIIPIEITPANAKRDVDISDWFERSISDEDLQLFTRQMYSLLRSGIPLLKAISGIAQTTESKKFQRVLLDVYQQLIQGQSLSSAFNQHPKVFDMLFVSMIHMGENTGKLDDVFLQLSQYIERNTELKKKISEATRYPKFVLSVIVFAAIMMNMFIIPKFASMFASFGGELPLPTQVMMFISDMFISYWPLLLIGSMGLFIAFQQWKKTPKGAWQYGRWAIQFPLIGNLIERALLARFSRCFSSMLTAGVPITTALSLVSDIMNNAYLREKVLGMRTAIESGGTLTQVAHESQMFTPLILQMFAVGEESGEMDILLEEVAEYYEREVNYDLKKLSSRLEPILLILITFMVAGLAVAVYLPMWSMMDAVSL